MAASSKIPEELVTKITLMAYAAAPHPLATMMDEFWQWQGINLASQWGGYDVPEDYLGVEGWFLFKPEPLRERVDKWVKRMKGEEG
jgi:hypothetical protein